MIEHRTLALIVRVVIDKPPFVPLVGLQFRLFPELSWHCMVPLNATISSGRTIWILPAGGILFRHLNES